MAIQSTDVNSITDSIGTFLATFRNFPDRQDESFWTTSDGEKLLIQAVRLLQEVEILAARKSDTSSVAFQGLAESTLDLIQIFPLKELQYFRRATGNFPISFLEEVLGLLASVLEKNAQLRGWLHDKTFGGVVAGLLAVSDDESLNTPLAAKSTAKNDMLRLLATYPVDLLVPSLMGLLKPGIPPWARQFLSKELARIPLRRLGVYSVIENMAAISDGTIRSDHQAQDVSAGQRTEPFHIQTLNHASQVLSIVPEGVDPELWYYKVASQLYGLLDGDAGQEFAKAAAYIIGIGILNRKLKIDKTGEIRWRHFITGPILAILCPDLQNDESILRSSRERNTTDRQPSLEETLTRLYLLLTSHPNPALTKRILDNLMIPIWSLRRIAKGNNIKTVTGKITELLKLYFTTASSDYRLQQLASNLFYRPKGKWQYASVKKKSISDNGVELEVIHLIEAQDDAAWTGNVINGLEIAVQDFLDFLKRLNASSYVLESLFSHLARNVLNPELLHRSLKATASSFANGDPPQKLVETRLIFGLLSEFPSQLVEKPGSILSLINELLMNVERKPSGIQGLPKSSGPQYARIVSLQTSTDSRYHNEPDNENIVSFAWSLLSVILNSPTFRPDRTELVVLSSIKSSIQSILSSKGATNPESLPNAATLLEMMDGFGGENPSAPIVYTPKMSLEEDRKSYSLSRAYLSEQDVPVRVQGLSLLEDLITKKSPVLDTPVVTILLVSLLQDPDEYMYLSVIRTMVSLAAQNPTTALKTLVERYADRPGDLELDHRLRIGEALSRILPMLGQLFGGDAAANVGQVCLGLAGLREERAPRASGEDTGRVEELPTFDEDLENIRETLETWMGKKGSQDLRIRASALSIFSIAVELNVQAIGPSLINSGLEVANGILNFEREKEKAILRRAAVTVIMAVIKAIGSRNGHVQSTEFGLGGASSMKLKSSVEHLLLTESDDLTRSYLEEVRDMLSATELRSFVPVGQTSITTRLDSLRVGSVEGINRPKIEEIE